MKPQHTSVIIGSVLLTAALFLGGCEGKPSTGGAGRDAHGHSHGHGHDHGDLPYEWSATYELDAATYHIVFEESEHDPAILIAFFRERDDFDDLAHSAYHAMERGGRSVTDGSLVTIQEGIAYNLILNPERSSYMLQFAEAGRYVMFTEHFAWEFNMKIFDAHGNEIEPENPADHVEPHTH